MTFAQIVEENIFRFSGSWITYCLQLVLTSLPTRAVTSLLELGGEGGGLVSLFCRTKRA